MTPPRWLHWPSTGSWTPANLADLRAWYKADAITGLSDGDPVSTWSDSSGGGYDLSSSSTARPLFETNTLNGLPVVEFDGTRYMQASTASDWTFLHSAGSSVVSVLKWQTSANPNAINLLAGTGVTSGSFWFIGFDDRSSSSRNNAFTQRVSGGAGFVVEGAVNDVVAPNQPLVFGLDTDPANGTAADRSIVYTDGGSGTTWNTYTGSASSTTPPSALVLGNRQASTSIAFVGYVAEIVFADAVLSSTDREKVEGYLAHKWGLTSSLPTGHPYKSSAP